MATKNNIFEDLARVSTSVASVMFESAKNVRESAKSRAQGVAKSVDLVTYDEFEVIRSIALKAKEASDSLTRDVTELKKQVQNIASTLDVIKQQVGKSGTDVKADHKILEQIKRAEQIIEKKLSEFGSAMQDHNAAIMQVNARLKRVEETQEVKQAEPKQKAKKVANSNTNDLFGDEQ